MEILGRPMARLALLVCTCSACEGITQWAAPMLGGARPFKTFIARRPCAHCGEYKLTITADKTLTRAVDAWAPNGWMGK